MKTRLPLAGLLALASLTPAFAETQPAASAETSKAELPKEQTPLDTLKEYISVEGYLAASWAGTKPKGSSHTDTLFDSGANNLDSAKVALVGKYENFSGKVSMLYVPESSDTSGISNAKVLDAYLAYTHDKITVTGGKFLSFMGYEAFEAVGMNQLTWGYASGVPAYRTGAKLEYAEDTYWVGFSVTDSFGSTGTILQKGDNDWSNGLGYELAASYTGIDKLTLFAGLGYNDEHGTTNKYMFDVWATYALTDKLTLGGEVSFLKNDSLSLIATAQYSFSDDFFLLGRVSAQRVENSSNTWGSYWTIAPTYKLSENLLVRAEYSYAASDRVPNSAVGARGSFYGAQVLLTF